MTAPATLLAEIRRELAYRRRTYPQRVEARRMTQVEADYQLKIMHAIEADMVRIVGLGPGAPLLPATHGFGWQARVEALQREATMRARLYPQWVDKGLMSQAEADGQNAALSAVLRLYLEGLDWKASNGAACDWHLPRADRATLTARAEWRTHAATLEHTSQQKELAL